jgi:hypothetical protein
MMRAIIAASVALAIAGWTAAGTGTTHAQSGAGTPPPGLSADIAVAPEAAECYVTVEYSTMLERQKFDLEGRRLGAPVRLPIWRATADVAANGQTGQFYTAEFRQGRLEILQVAADGLTYRDWPTGYTSPPVDLAVDDLAAQVSTVLAAPGLDAWRVDVLTFSLTGTLQETWSTSTPGQPTALARDPARAAWLAAREGTGGRVYMFDGQGAATGSWTVGFEPLALAVGPNDVYVAGVTPEDGEGVLARFGRAGEPRADWPLFGPPTDLDVGPDGMVYALARRGGGLDLVVEKFTPDGMLLLRWSAISRAYLPAARRHGR